MMKLIRVWLAVPQGISYGEQNVKRVTAIAKNAQAHLQPALPVKEVIICTTKNAMISVPLQLFKKVQSVLIVTLLVLNVPQLLNNVQYVLLDCIFTKELARNVLKVGKAMTLPVTAMRLMQLPA